MDVEWDPAKAAANLRKHGVRFAEAVLALEDAHAVTVEDREHDERRFVTIGADSKDRIVVVVWTERGGRLRVISARKATRVERQQYCGTRP
jgi:uncharacterized protein